ncbi:MAG: glycosyltransferase [Acidobacteriota bacterium]|nr:glycosyltransferase [Acidobacteriota bacterium]
MSTKPNVLQLIDSFIQGGTERQMVQLTRLLHESGNYHIHVACLNGSGVLRGEIDRLGFAVPEFPLTSFYNVNMIHQVRNFAALLSRWKIDIIHTHDFYSNIFGMMAAMIGGVPARIASRRETLGMRSKAQKRVERISYRIAHSVIANASAVSDQLIEEGVRADKIAVVYNGLDLKRMEPRAGLSEKETRAMFNLPEQRKLITIVANLSHTVKDHPMFLRVAQRISSAEPGAAFLVAGEGGLIEQMQGLARDLNIEKEVFLLGRCNHVPELLAISDICVLTSTAEGFSNSILEYMAASRPVVATDVGGAREAIVEGQTGYLVPSGDDVLMADRIIGLLRDPTRAATMGKLGRRVVDEKFSCDAQLRTTEALYEDLLGRRRNKSFATG